MGLRLLFGFFGLFSAVLAISKVQIFDCTTNPVNVQGDWLFTMNVSASPRPLRCTIQFVMKSPMLRPTLYIPVEKFNNMNDYVRIVQNAPCQNVLTLSQNSTREPAYDICPTDFSIELSLTGVFDDLMIEMIKITAKRTRTFPVGPYLANLIYTKDLLPLDRINFNSSSGLPLTIRPISFNSSEKSSMDQVFFYSGDIFMGSLLSLQMSNSTLSAMNLALVTPLYYVAWHWPDFAVMVSQLPGFLGTNSYQSIPVNSEGTTQVQNFTAGNYYIIDQDYSAENSNTLTNFTFDSNNTKLTIYAGCVVNPFEGLKVVTITNDTVKNFTRVVVKSTCRTYVVEQGTVSMATTFDNLFYGLSSPAINGTIGAIMTSLMPTQAENNSFWIKASDGSKITVSYDFPLFNNASTDGLTFKVDDGSTQNLIFQGKNGTGKIGPSTRHNISYSVPANTAGTFVRYSLDFSQSGNTPRILLAITFLILSVI